MTTRARREREKEERRQSILLAAQEVFFESGFHRATVEAVAERAEVSKGTVYLYFESKETILAHLLLGGLGELVAELAQAYGVGRDLAADERLRRLGRTYLRFFEREPQYFRLLMAMDRGSFRDTVTPVVYQEVLEASIEGLNWAVRAVAQGLEDGTFGGCEPRQAAAMLVATLNGLLELMEHPLRREMVGVDRETLYRAAYEIFIRGLRAAPQGDEKEVRG